MIVLNSQGAIVQENVSETYDAKFGFTGVICLKNSLFLYV